MRLARAVGFFAAALGLNCTGCHVAESLQNWDKFAEDVPRKRMARVMIQMVNNINKANFGGRRAITCYTSKFSFRRVLKKESESPISIDYPLGE